ncbi:Phage protein [Escherichia phage rV5_ev147]|nr:Phage protein [Escherichia phage rV5_ev147]VVA46327.1 Phage protein [Escherichia phage rV5_ev156]
MSTTRQYTKVTIIACVVGYILAQMLMSSANSFAKFFLNF